MSAASRESSVPRGGFVPDRPIASPGHVRRITVPPSARALSTLARVDYADAFLVEVDRVGDRTAEQWVRAIFDEAPTHLRLRLWSAWLALGFRLSTPDANGCVLGWSVRESTRNCVVLGSNSSIGMPAELLLMRHERRLLFDTFVEQDNPIARAVWASVQPVHTRAVPWVLQQFVQRVCEVADE
jgi:Protein of unknown function (DUF2867)